MWGTGYAGRWRSLRVLAGAAVCGHILAQVFPAEGYLYTLEFERDAYVAAPGQALQLKVGIDPAASGGLFSYGVRLRFGAGPIPGASLQAAVPLALDHDGPRGRGAVLQVLADGAGAKGTVDMFASPIGYYTESLLAEFSLTLPAVGEYRLELDLFNTLGPTEDIFVTGDGTVLDRVLGFGGATVRVIPEPAVPAAALGGSILLLLRCRGVRRLRGLLANLRRSSQESVIPKLSEGGQGRLEG